MKKSQLLLGVGLALLVMLTGCERPPTDTVQHGFRGTGMVQNDAEGRCKIIYCPVHTWPWFLPCCELRCYQKTLQ